jgi:DNA-binding CsgD family transcriptional regulator/cell division inhibitor SulA
MGAFVGRATELASLVEITRGADEVAAAVIVGEPGTGKSRLLAEATGRSAVPREFRVVGYEAERNVPLAAAADLLRSLADASGTGRRLGELLFDAPREERSALEPVRVFEAAHRALRRGGPALVVVDDVQWLDDLSLALCHYLVRAADAGGDALTLIAAGRPSPNEEVLSASLTQVLDPVRLRRVELGPLPEDDARELVKSLAPSLDERQRSAIIESAAGFPFWLEALVHTGGAEADAGRLVTARLRGASADAVALFALLAVAARPLALADVGRLNEWSSDRVELAARELVTRGLAVDSGSLLRLAHDLIRAAAVREIAEEQRVEIHERVADWLADIARTDVRRLREALAHRYAAGLPSLDLAARLARSPQRTLLGEEGLSLLVAIADEADPGDQAVQALHEDIAALAATLGRHDVTLTRHLALAERRRDPLLRARALLGASKAATALSDSDAARTYLDRARATCRGDELLDLELDIQQAVLDLWSSRPKEGGRAVAHAAVAKARRLSEADERGRRTYLDALRVEHEAAYQEDDDEAMLRAADQGANVARGFDEEAFLTASLESARALRRIGRLDEALERAQRVWDEARSRVLPRLTLDAGYWLTTFLLQSGRVADAGDVAATAAELAGRVGDEARGRHSLERLLSEIDFQSGEWRGGVERLLAYADVSSEHAGVELHQLAALWLALAAGSEVADEVLAQVRTARRCSDRAACPRCATELWLAGADALAHAGGLPDAAEWLAEWRRMERRPRPRDRYLDQRVEALIHEPADAAGLEKAARTAEELGFGLDALWTRADLGEALAAADRSRAKETLAAVAETAAARGAQTVTEVAEKRLRALGVRTWRRGVGAGLLSERELAVVRLIAEGASNPEIAQRLFVSRKTVERHVSNVLRKTGSRNRAELAARVPELELEGVRR